MVSVRALVGIAAAGGVVTSITGYTFHSILQKRVRDSPVYKEAMSIISSHSAVVSLLGKPVKADYVDVGNKNNVLSLRYSTLEVPVYGPKNKGVLLIGADRLTDEDQWNLFKVELELSDSAGGKLSVINKDPVLKTSSSI